MACGALAPHIAGIAKRRGWRIDVHALAPLLHNRPGQIAGAVERHVRALGAGRVAVAYADCGTYGALDEVCDRLNVPRLPGPHCYATFAGEKRLEDLLRDRPGTYLLTDFLVRSFHRSVIAELGLDRHPELRDDYFRHYTRAVWLAQSPTPGLRAAAEHAAERLGLPLTVITTSDSGLEDALERLLARAAEVDIPAPHHPHARSRRGVNTSSKVTPPDPARIPEAPPP